MDNSGLIIKTGGENLPSLDSQSSEQCLFCLKNVQQGDFSEKQVEIQRFLTLLERYLEADPGPGEEKRGSIDKVSSFREGDLVKRILQDGVVLSCEDCHRVVSTFCDLYTEIKRLEVKVNWKVWKLTNIMAQANRVPARTSNFRKSLLLWENGEVEKANERFEQVKGFRRRIIKNGKFKLLDTFPKIVLKKCDAETCVDDSSERKDDVISPEDSHTTSDESHKLVQEITSCSREKIDRFSQTDERDFEPKTANESLRLEGTHTPKLLLGEQSLYEKTSLEGSVLELNGNYDRAFSNNAEIGVYGANDGEGTLVQVDYIKIDLKVGNEQDDDAVCVRKDVSPDITLCQLSQPIFMNGPHSPPKINELTTSLEREDSCHSLNCIENVPDLLEVSSICQADDSIYDEIMGMDQMDSSYEYFKGDSKTNICSERAETGTINVGIEENAEQNPAPFSKDLTQLSSLEPSDPEVGQNAAFDSLSLKKCVDDVEVLKKGSPLFTRKRSLRIVFRCIPCCKTFTSQDKLQLHKKSHHEGEKEDEKISTAAEKKISNQDCDPCSFDKMECSNEGSEVAEHDFTALKSEIDAEARNITPNMLEMKDCQNVELAILPVPNASSSFVTEIIGINLESKLATEVNVLQVAANPDQVDYTRTTSASYSPERIFPPLTFPPSGNSGESDDEICFHLEPSLSFLQQYAAKKLAEGPRIPIARRYYCPFKSERDIPRESRHWLDIQQHNHLTSAQQFSTVFQVSRKLTLTELHPSLRPCFVKLRRINLSERIPTKFQENGVNVQDSNTDTKNPQTQGNGLNANTHTYVCEKDDCSKKSGTSTDLNSQRKSSYKWKRSATSCPNLKENADKCGECLAPVESVMKRILRKRKVRSKLLILCKDCGMQFKEWGNLRKHRLKKHLKHIKKNDWNKKFEMSSDLHAHKAELKKYTCEKCGKAFKSKWKLKDHDLMHTGPESWLFSCSSCGRKCRSKHKLALHERTHTQEKYSCNCKVCGIEYARTSSLKLHINKKHPDYSVRLLGNPNPVKAKLNFEDKKDQDEV